jgi:hypothetical protein
LEDKEMENESLAQAFGLSQYAIQANMDDVDHEESLSAADPGGNCMNWVAGHVLNTRDMLLSQLGGEAFLREDEARPYARGAKRLKAGDHCVNWDRLKEGLAWTSENLCGKLKSLSQEDLDKSLDPSDFPVPVEHHTLGALCALLLFHEGYHAGQLGAGRRLLGKEGKLK